MGTLTDLPSEVKEVDVIIAGGGTAGCIIAARLAAAKPDLSVLVIESGSDGAGNPVIEYPGLFIANLAPDSTTVSFYKSHASDKVSGREIVVPTGNVLGGGSAVNMMAYNRGSRRDWDSWQAPGWSATEILPFIKKLETYKGPGKQDTHGFEGPITVSRGTFTSTRLQQTFVNAMDKVGWPEIEDINDLESGNGVQRPVRYISPDGKRQDTASGYLRPVMAKDQNKNLRVLVQSKVIRLVVEDGRAVGVVYRPASDKTAERAVKATKMVIVSAGAFGTPAILERSGIGSPAVLDKAGVSVVADLPGVGQNFQDHELILHSYKSSLGPEETLDKLFSSAVSPADMIQAGDPMLGWNAQDATCKIRPNEKDLASLGPRFQEAWAKDFEHHAEKTLIMIALLAAYPGPPLGGPPAQYFSMSTFTTYPYARGHVHITGPGVDDPVDFDTGFFADENELDIVMQRWAYKKQREVARRMEVYRGELAVMHPPFPAESAAACKDFDGPLTDVQDIVYSAEDDAIIDKWLRDNVASTWHSQGTCKMAPRDQDGVVDERLNVHGIKGLKIADLSIMPVNVAANTGHTALVIGEKAADIIIKDLGLVDE